MDKKIQNAFNNITNIIKNISKEKLDEDTLAYISEFIDEKIYYLQGIAQKYLDKEYYLKDTSYKEEEEEDYMDID